MMKLFRKRGGSVNGGKPAPFRNANLRSEMARLREANRLMLARVFLKSTDISSYSPEAKEEIVRSFSRLPGVLSAFSDVQGFGSWSRFRKLKAGLRSEDEQRRDTSLLTLRMIASDAEVYGERAARKASQILAKQLFYTNPRLALSTQ